MEGSGDGGLPPPHQHQQQLSSHHPAPQQPPFDHAPHSMQMMYPGAPGVPPSMYPPPPHGAEQMMHHHPDMMHPPPIHEAMMGGPMCDRKYEEHILQLNEKLLQIKQEIERMPKNDIEKFKEQKLPLARIKKLMKSDEDVRMISAEAPILFAKACEMFIIEMTHKAYYYAARNNRKTLQRNDIAAAITDTEVYDFLLDIMPRDEMIQSSKDKILSQYQMQLLDDVHRMQEIQRMQQLGGGNAPAQPLPPQPHFPMQYAIHPGASAMGEGGGQSGEREDYEEEEEESVSKDGEESKKN